MNPLFLRPPSATNSKTNLEKVKKLVQSDQKSTKSDENLKHNIPNNWIYNEAAAKQVWDDLENGEVTGVSLAIEQSPFQKIDESASRIRQTIANYELEDQDMLMNLIDIVGDDTSVDTFDQENILMEARMRLYTMITEHVDNSDVQKRMLDSLRIWFNELQKGKTNDDPDFQQPKMDKTADINALLALLGQVSKSKDETVEHAANLHEDIVSNLNKRVSEIQKQLNQKDFLLSQVSDPNQNNSKRGRRSISRRNTPVCFDSELSLAQRKVLEMENQITNLKQALIEYAKPSKDGEEKKSIMPLISLEKEFELDQKISVLMDEIKSLKGSNKYLQTQIGKNKQNEIVLENKLSIADKTKKALEGKIQALELKLDNLENVHEEKIRVARNEVLIAKDHDDFASIESTKDFQKQIQDMAEQQKLKISQISDDYERRFRQQMKELSSAYESGDQSKILSTTVDSYNKEIKKLQKLNEEQLREQQKLLTSQLLELSLHYERILKRKDKEIEMIKNSTESTLKTSELTLKMNFEEDKARNMLIVQENHNDELCNLRIEFSKKFDSLKNKINKLSNERDILRNLIETSTISNMLDEINFDMDEEEEEEDGEDDDVLIKSLRTIKEREIEKKVAEKYISLLDQQKRVFKENKLWEIEQTKLFYEAEGGKFLSDFRESTINEIRRLFRLIPNSRTTLEDLLMGIIKQLGKNDKQLPNHPMVPLNDVDNKMDELKSRIVQLESENNMWKSTIDKIGGDPANSNKDEVVKAIRDIIQEQAENFAQINHDRDILSRQVTQLKSQQNQEERMPIYISGSSNLLVARPNMIKYCSIESVAIYSIGHFDQSKIKIDSKDSYDPQYTVIQSGAKFTRPKFVRTKASVVVHYFSALKNNNTANDHEKAKPSQKNYDTKSKIGENLVCCPECSNRFIFDPADVRERKLKSRYIRCPECLTPYNLSLDEIVEEINSVPVTKTPFYSKPEKKRGTKKITPNKSDSNFNLMFDDKESLQNKLDAMTKQSMSLEQNYQIRLHKAEEDLLEMRKVFFEYSLKILHCIKQTDDEQQIIETVMNISEKIRDLMMAQGEQKNCNIDILERLKSTKINVENIFEQEKSLLISLYDAPMKFVTKNVIKTIPIETYEDTTKIETANKENELNEQKKRTERAKILANNVQNASKKIKDLKQKNVNLKPLIKALIEEHKLVIDKLKAAYLELSQKSTQNTIKVKQEIEKTNSLLIKEKEENEKNKETIRKNMLEIEDLDIKLNEVVSKLKQLTIKEQVQVDNINALAKMEDESKASIDNLTNTVLRLRDIIHNQEKENENLKLAIQSLEAREEIYTAYKNCKLTWEKPTKVFSYPDSDIDEMINGSMLPPPLKGLSKLNNDNSGISTPSAGKVPQFSERIRVRYTNSDRPQSAAARVFVPNKGKTPISKTPRGAIVQTTVEVPTEGSSQEDGNSSIVVYVTPFLKEKPHVQPKSTPGLIPANYSPTASAPLQPVSEAEVQKYMKVETLNQKESVVNEAFFKDLEKRIQFLEMQLLEAQKEVHLERDRTHEANQALFKAAIQNQKAVREIKKQTLMKDNANKGMMKAISMVSERDQTITMLQKKITRFNNLASRISDNIEKNIKDESDKNDNIDKKKPKMFFDKDIESETNDVYSKIMKSLNNNQIFSSMAQNEMKTIERLQKLRQKTIEDEQLRIMGALDAMCFLTQPPLRPNNKAVKVTSSRSLKANHPSARSSGKKEITRKTIVATNTPRRL